MSNNKINLNQLSRGDSVRTDDGIAYVTRAIKTSEDKFFISLLFNSRHDQDTNLRFSKDGTCSDSEIFSIEEIIYNPNIFSAKDMYDCSRYGADNVNIDMCKKWIAARIPTIRTKIGDIT